MVVVRYCETFDCGMPARAILVVGFDVTGQQAAACESHVNNVVDRWIAAGTTFTVVPCRHVVDAVSRAVA